MLNLTTDYLPLNLLIFVIGLIVLIKSSDWFVDAAVYIATHFKVPEIIIGLTLVSIGTSLPELATNICASVAGQGDIALGNVTGSNIANLGLVLGVGVLLAKGMQATKRVWLVDTLIMIITSFAVYAMCFIESDSNNYVISKIGGGVLLLGFFAYIYFLLTHKSDSHLEEVNEETEHKFKGLFSAGCFIVIGLILIFLSAKVMVDNVVKVATDFNFSQALIAATVVAFGTSVPELAVTITSSMKNKNSLALGNIIGSCIFNILLVLGVSSMIAPVPVSKEMINFVIPFMLLISVLCFIFMKTHKFRIIKWEGWVLLGLYLFFITYNVCQVYGWLGL